MSNVFLDSLLSAANAASQPEADDFRGEDGLMYCGKCHTPREMLLNLGFVYKGSTQQIVPVMCACRKLHYEAEQQAQRNAEAQERINALRRSSLMDAAFANSTFENAKSDAYNKRALVYAKRYTERFDEMVQKGRGLLFYGPPGTGKTYIASCIANALLDMGVPVMATSFVKLTQDVFGRDAPDTMDAMNKAKLLVIDDLGAERGSDTSLESVYRFIDNRVRTGLPLILTTNLMLTDLQHPADIRYARIFDRVLQMCWPIEVNGVSRRQRGAAKMFQEMADLLGDE